ncbi:hypothetical protein BGZ74_005410, partial [Mortierella antarctica]
MTTTIVTASVQQQPSFAHAQPVSSMPVVFTPQPHPLLPRPSIAPPPTSIPVNNYYHQQTHQPPYQIPVVGPQAAAFQQQQQQQQHQQQIQYEQTQQHDQREQEKQRELKQQRIKQAQLEEEFILARHIEEQMARLQTLKDQRQSSEVGSPVPNEGDYRGTQIDIQYAAAPHVQDESRSYVQPPSAATSREAVSPQD